MEGGGGVGAYPANVLLANDDRMPRFLDASVCREWNAAVQEWRTQKQTGVACEKQETQSSLCGDLASTSRSRNFSDEEFFTLTQQLEDITAVLAGMSAPYAAASVAAAQGGTDAGCSSGDIRDLLELDPAMYATSLDEKQRHICQLASELYQKGEYSKSAEAFSTVIDSCLPNVLNAALISNRALCYLRTENYKLCLRDATRSYEMDSRYVLGMRRAIRSYICCGRCAEAREIIERHRKKGYGSFEQELTEVALYERYAAFLERNEHVMALKHLNELLERVPCATVEALKVQLLAIEEGNQAALVYTNKCLCRYADSPELLYWRAQLRFLESTTKTELEAVLPLLGMSVPTDHTARFRQAASHVQQCIDLCQDLDSLFTNKEWQRLIELCSATIQRPYIGERLRMALLAKRARGFYEIKRSYECMDDINIALRSVAGGKERAELLLLKAHTEERLGRLSDAVRSAMLSLREHHTAEAVGVWQRLSQRQKEHQRRKQQQETQDGRFAHGDNAPENDGARAEARDNNTRSARTNRSAPEAVAKLYACLSLPDGAGVDRVKKSYRALAMRWHPDKWCGASEHHQKEAEEKFKLVKASYDELMRILDE
ncbi:putative TPR-repeat protein [Trypanosoma grayi]|uniref:putative TPR-repeat protein n=1 Tax=Trypanosoma grayi TaxID=71804 RepID=UPI0004F4005E|nr:putative TPR-repeat protein [Trypanosoma grayi]KEG14166.1 putative TPR-repeat protein [Trypanosoma grayi]